VGWGKHPEYMTWMSDTMGKLKPEERNCYAQEPSLQPPCQHADQLGVPVLFTWIMSIKVV